MEGFRSTLILPFISIRFIETGVETPLYSAVDFVQITRVFVVSSHPEGNVMKKYLIAALAALTLTAQPALADTAIGVVNVPKIMQSSKAAVSLRSQLEAKQKAFQSELDAKQKELLAQKQEILKQKDKIDKDAFQKRAKEFQDKEIAATKQIQGKRESLDKAFNASVEEIQKNVIEITKAVATEKKLNLVITSLQVLTSDQSLDITDEVMKRLDAKLPSVAVKF